jgi:enoyl-CoA hydratase/carnithine racemase
MIKLADYRNKYRNFKLERTDDGVLTVQFQTNGGPILWGLEPVEELGHLWADVNSDRANKVVIVTGTGAEFVVSMSVADGSWKIAEDWDRISSNVKRMMRNHLSVEVPMIAAVNGPARIHSEQALLCDIVIASTNADFQDSPHFNAGMVPGDGVQICYNHLLGSNRARYFMMMGEIIPAQKALELGLVSEVHAPDKLQARALEIARHLLKQPEMLRRYTRQVCVEPLRRLYADLLDHGLALEGLGAWSGLKPPGQ